MAAITLPAHLIARMARSYKASSFPPQERPMAAITLPAPDRAHGTLLQGIVLPPVGAAHGRDHAPRA